MDVALVGVAIPGVQNHSLAVLRRAVERANRTASIIAFEGWATIARVVEAVRREEPKVCGISIQTSESALASLALCHLLRRSGYRGRIVCGGHFATLNAHHILQAPAGVDAVVRFAGESALAMLSRSRWDDGVLANVPGLVFRAADGSIREGAPADVSTSPALYEPDEPLPVHLGFPAADVVFSRGCDAKCSYCCVAGATRLAREEAARSGLSAVHSGPTRASEDEIVDHLAWLWHHKGARVFNLMDDNLLPLQPREAVRFVKRLGTGLGRRGVGRIAFSMQLRADVLTPEVSDALAELGLVRAYVGIDGYSREQLRAIGRAANADAGSAAIQRLGERGVLPVCNALLIGPTLSLESIHAEIAGIARIQGAPVHLLPIEAREGTAYQAAVQRAGLLEGGFLWTHYRFSDPRTALLAEIVTSFPTRLQLRSVPIALYDLAYNLGICRRLLPSAQVDALATAYARIADRWNADQLRVLTAAHRAAASEDRHAVDALIAAEGPRVRAHDEALLAECDQALAVLERAAAAASRASVRVHARARLLSSVALSMGLAGCGLHSPPADRPDGGAVTDAGNSKVGLPDASGDPGVPDSGVPDSGVADAGPCVDGGTSLFGQLVCNSCVAPLTGLEFTFDTEGRVVDVNSTASQAPLSPTGRDCLLALVGGYCFPSFAGTTQTVQSHCWIA
jgi:hypothetical protein